MVNNTIEIEFLSPDEKKQFIELIGNMSGPFLERLFPWPPKKLNDDLKAYDKYIWSEATWGMSPYSFSKLLGIKEQGQTLICSYRTLHKHISYAFMRNLYFLFPIRRIRLSFYVEHKSVCMRKKRNGRYVENCKHKFCQKHSLQREIVLDWSNIPHPVYQVQDTIQFLKRLFWNLKDNEIGRLYHHIIFTNTFFSMYDNSIFATAKETFGNQASVSANPYLTLLTLTNTYGQAPNTVGLEINTRMADIIYIQPDISKASLIGPLRISR